MMIPSKCDREIWQWRWEIAVEINRTEMPFCSLVAGIGLFIVIDAFYSISSTIIVVGNGVGGYWKLLQENELSVLFECFVTSS